MSISSTFTVQNLIDYARTFDDCIPTVGLAGYSRQPALSFANHVKQRIMAENNPWKWNSYQIPIFYTQPYQQDYPTNISSDTLGWLESGTFVDINNPAGTPQYFIQPPLQCVARLLPTYIQGVPSQVCWIMNRNARTAQWPGNGITFQNPLVSQGGGPGSNNITAIIDPNGNIQVVTTYGTTLLVGTPSWPLAGSAPGTTTADGSVVWTLQDPNGIALRVNALATFGSNVWELHITYQQKPQPITSLAGTFDPIPDDLQYLIEQGFLTLCRKKGKGAPQFESEYRQWLLDIQRAMVGGDRETQTFGMYPSNSLQGGGPGGNTGAAWGYPGWLGWSSGG